MYNALSLYLRLVVVISAFVWALFLSMAAHAKPIAVMKINEIEQELAAVLQEETGRERVMLENIRLQDKQVSIGAPTFTMLDVLSGKAGYTSDDELTLLSVTIQPVAERFEIGGLVTKSDGKQRDIKLFGRYTPMVAIPVLTSPKQPGEMIANEELITKFFRERSIRRGVITSTKSLRGMLASRYLSAGAMLHSRDVERPTLIKKGALTPVYFKTPHMELRVIAKALEVGYADTIIRLRNVDSGTIIKAWVDEHGKALVNYEDAIMTKESVAHNATNNAANEG